MPDESQKRNGTPADEMSKTMASNTPWDSPEKMGSHSIDTGRNQRTVEKSRAVAKTAGMDIVS